MAEQTVNIYSGGDGATADMMWNDVAMTASGVQVHIPPDGNQRIVTAVIGGQPVNVTYPPGTDTFFSFPEALPVAIKTNFKNFRGLDLPWFGSFGVATEAQ